MQSWKYLSSFLSVIVSLLWVSTVGTASALPIPPQADAAKAAISGTVSDASGTGVAGVAVAIHSDAGDKSLTTDAQGNYSAGDLAPGPYTVTVTAAGAKAFEANVALSAGQTLNLGVGLSSGGTQDAAAQKGAIVGNVNELSGKGVPATVQVHGGEGISQLATADAQGQFVAADLPAGAYTVTVTAKGVKVFAANVALGPAQVLTLGIKGPLVAQSTSPAPLPGLAAAGAAAAAAATAAPENAPAAAAGPAPGVQQAPPTNAEGGVKVSGQVSDQTGAVVPGATVKLAGATGAALTTTADDKGAYAFNGVAPGTYTLTVTASGFKEFKAEQVNVAAGADIPLDAPLEPAGATPEVVNVEGSKVNTIETENAEVSGTLTNKEVSTLQLNGRNFTQLITLTPGVSNQTGQDEAKVGVQGSVKYSVNGGRVEYNSFNVDGSDVLNAGLSGAESTLVVYPSLDAIQEVKVLTSNYGAQYGRTASGTVEVTTKSGGSKWHGNAYEFFRNEAFNARNYFDQTSRAPYYRRNDFGVTIGGPLSIPGFYNTNKQKTFVFFSEEVRIEKSPSELEPTFNHAVPSLAERQGDFSDVCPSPTDPQDLKKLINVGQNQFQFPVASFPDCPGVPLRGAPGYRLMFSNSLPDGSVIYNNLNNSAGSGVTNAGLDPNALAILNQNLIPLPNAFDGCNSTLVGKLNHTTGQLNMPCYDATISLPTHWHEELFRVDHNISQSLLATFRFIHDSWDTVTPTPNWGTVRNSFPTVQNDFVGPGIDLMFRLTQRYGAKLVNETVFSYNNSHITLANKNGPGGADFTRPAGLGDPTKVGQCTVPGSGPAQCPLGYFFNNGFGNKVPGIVLTGNNAAYGGAGFTVDPSYMPWEHTNPTYNVRDDLTRSFGNHTLQFGVQWVVAQKNEINGALGAASGDVQGLLTFSNINGGLANTGNAFANFLYNEGSQSAATGGGNAIKSYTQDSTQLRYYNRYQTIEPYVQDDWKITKRLTVNLGVRFSIFYNYHEKYNNAYNWDPGAYNPALAGQFTIDPLTGQMINHPGFRPVPLDLNNLDPRIINGFVRCGVNNVPSTCGDDHPFNPAPRVGFAWDPLGDGRTSIRAGYGLFYEHGTGDEANTGSLEGSAPLVLSVTQDFPVSYACIGLHGPNCGSSAAVSLPGAFPINATGIPTRTKYSSSQQWSLSVQRELPHSLVGSVAYVGSKGTHLTVERQLNQLRAVSSDQNPFSQHEPFLLQVPGSIAADCDNRGSGSSPIFILQNGTIINSNNPASINLQIACQGQSSSVNFGSLPVVNTFRPYLGFGQIFSLQNVANSSYHSFQATLRRTRGPLTAGVAYSYSHSIDESSDRTDPTFVDSLDLRSNRASSNFDQRHLLNISYIYSLPKLSTRFQNWIDGGGDTQPSTSSTTSRFARLFADGWQWSGITTYQSGTPFSIINNAGAAGIGVLDNAGVANGIGAGSFPDLAVGPVLGKPAAGNNSSSFGPLLGNPNIFVAPRGLTFGDAGRNVFNNPSRLNFDMSLLKHFPIREGSEVEFRLEAFNVFNHTQFRLFNPDLGNTGSNTINCYGGPNYSSGAYFPGGVDCLTGSSFLHPVDAHRPRTLQLALKYTF